MAVESMDFSVSKEQYAGRSNCQTINSTKNGQICNIQPANLIEACVCSGEEIYTITFMNLESLGAMHSLARVEQG